MSIFYKNQGFKQSDTSKATVLTCPTDGTIIVKSIYCANNDASSGIVVQMNFVDSSDSNTEYELFLYVTIVVQSIFGKLSVFILSIY